MYTPGEGAATFSTKFGTSSKIMLKGTVNFKADVVGNGLSFPRVEFNPNEPGVDKVVIEGPQGDEILSTVHLSNVTTADEGRLLATKVNTIALNRLAYYHSVAITEGRYAGDQFSPLNPAPGTVHLAAATVHLQISGSAKVVLGIQSAAVKTELEQASPPGERYFGLVRSAMLSASAVERYMHLYNILLMLYSDIQAQVDSFVINEDPAVPRTPHPRNRNANETVYTRLRNEFAHFRAGVNMATTKQEMENRVGSLVALVKKAVVLHQ